MAIRQHTRAAPAQFAHPQRRKPYPAVRKRKGRPFTLAIWRDWLADRWPDERTVQLRAGVDELRRRLEGSR